MENKELSNKLIELVGGKNNIKYVTHCVTRLRFVLKDEKKVKKEEIDNLEDVIGSTFGSGQYQILLGAKMTAVFNEIVKDNLDIQVGELVDENLDDLNEEKKKKGIKDYIIELFNFVSSCVTPIVAGITVAGLIKVVLVLINLVWSGFSETSTYSVINTIINASFYFLPVYVAYGTSLKTGCTPIYAIIVACLLIHPDMIALLTGEETVTIFGLSIYHCSYASSFLPAILSTLAVTYLERFFDKYLPGAFKGIFVGAITIVLATALTLTILGPIGFFCGQYFINFLLWLQNTIGPFALGILGGILPYVIMSGMHTVFGPVMVQSIATVGYEGFLRPTQFIHNVAEGGSCFGVALRTKNPELKSEAFSSGVGAILAGVSEPAIYGINMRLKKPMKGVMAGGCLGGIVAGLMHVRAFSYGNPSILALPIYEKTIPGILLAIVVAFITSAIVSYFSGFEDIPVKND